MSNIINYIKTQCVVLYFIGFFGYYNLQKIKDISTKPMQCTCIEQYVHYFIDDAKESFIRNCKDARKIKMNVKMYDDYNTKHNFIMEVLTIINKEQFTKVNLKTLVVIEIIDETVNNSFNGPTSFIGVIGFITQKYEV